MPLSRTAGLLKKASISPKSIPNTGPPIMGNAFPRIHAGTAIMKQAAMPARVFVSKNLSFILPIISSKALWSKKYL